MYHLNYSMIKIDYREKKLIPIIQSLNNDYNFNINIEVENLPIGDIIIYDKRGNEKLIIERKTLNDLAASIRDGRYSEQSFRLENNSLHNLLDPFFSIPISAKLNFLSLRLLKIRKYIPVYPLL